jgi:hypothetical protein
MPENHFIKKILNYLDKILGVNDSINKKQSLDYISRLRWLKLKVFTRGFLLGFFLYPWVLVWGLWLFLLGSIYYLEGTDYLIFVTYRSSIPYPIAGLTKGSGYEWWFIFLLGGALLINYTISLFSYRKNQALGIIMLVVSLWLILMAYLYVYTLWRFNLNFHSN